jgi:AraC-like DNA-binding protein
MRREEDRELIPGERAEAEASRFSPSSVILVDSRKQLTSSFGGWVVAERYPEPIRSDIHQAFEIGVLLTGRQERLFDDFQTELMPGGFYLSPAWERHDWRTSGPGTHTLMIHFLPDFLGEEGFEGTSWLTLFALPASDRVYSDSPSTRERVLAVAHEIMREIEAKRWGWLAGVRLNVLRLLHTAWGEWWPTRETDQHPTVEMGDLGRLAPAMDLVRSRPAQRTTLDEGARSCSLGRSQFSALFRKTMGLSFGQFVSRFRVLKAAEFLVQTDWPLERIAEELGFSDAAHLHRTFVQHYACTPGHYRKGQHPEGVLPERPGPPREEANSRALLTGRRARPA